MSGFSTEKKFIVAEGEEGEIYFFIEAKKNQPQAPQIVYDGKDHALFRRNEDQNIILDYIHPSVRDQLRKAHEVVIVEMILENIKDSYIARMRHVDNIPVDWSKAGLKSWEEACLEHHN